MTKVKNVDSELGLCSRFRIDGFNVPVRLIGNTHTVIVDGRRVDVMLPWKYWDREKADENQEYKAVASATGWRPKSKSKNSTLVVYRVGIGEIIVHVHATKTDGLNLPKDINKIKNINDRRAEFERVNNEDVLDDRFDALFNVTLSQFDRWCRLLRLKTGKYYFEQSEFGSERSTQSSYFATSHDLRRLRGSNHRTIIYVSDDVTTRQWNVIGRAFEKGEAPEVWFDLLCEAKHRAHYGENRGAVVALAVATETYVRRRISKSLSRLQLRDPVLFEQIDRMSIQRLLEKRDKISALKKLGLNKDVVKELGSMFVVRNDIMHKGRTDIGSRSVEAYLAAVERLIA